MFDSLEVRHDLSNYILFMLNFIRAQKEAIDPYQLNTLTGLQTGIFTTFFTTLFAWVQQPLFISHIEC